MISALLYVLFIQCIHVEYRFYTKCDIFSTGDICKGGVEDSEGLVKLHSVQRS